MQDDAYGKAKAAPTPGRTPSAGTWSPAPHRSSPRTPGPYPSTPRPGWRSDLEIGAYVGVPIRDADGTLYGTICGLDPDGSPERLDEHEPLLRLFATLLGQILKSEHLRAEPPTGRPRWRGPRSTTS